MLGNVSGQGKWDRALLKTHEDGNEESEVTLDLVLPFLARLL